MSRPIVTTALGTDSLLFHAMTGSEELGRLSEFRVQLLSKTGDISPAALLGEPLTVALTLVEGTRWFNGIVTRFTSTGWEGDYVSYEAVVHPWLWLLKRSSTCQIFQDLTVLEIVKQVCTKEIYAGVSLLSAELLSGVYPKLPYCVQYRETDFDFVCRLLEDAGIYFFFTHEADKHTLVLADSYGAHQPITGYQSLKFAGSMHTNALDEESIGEWAVSGEIQSGCYALTDYDYEKASASSNGGLLSKALIPSGFGAPDFELFDYPGNYTSAETGNALALARMERAHGQSVVVKARSNARGLFCGGLFTLSEHPREDQNLGYLITGAQYELYTSRYASGVEGSDVGFDCSFTAIGKDHAYRPQCAIAKPVVQGPQTALVVGKSAEGSDEEIWTDALGRIKVQFHWDRLGVSDEASSCWVRVAQTWAGKGWGAIFIPRVGMEVVVSFLEGNPDRPLVTGCVYNSDALPPYELPAFNTQSGIKTRSSPKSEGFNELRFEDKAGEEEVFMHAEKDFNRVVKNDDTLTVTGDQKITVEKTIVITATTSIELVVGGSTIKIEPEKITILSALVEIN
ncbi:MAG TPA: type VI secretion system tip protein TssI/VgrG [Pseudomonas sp.]|jgi:type VI secretion system secreted protein VgrG